MLVALMISTFLSSPRTKISFKVPMILEYTHYSWTSVGMRPLLRLSLGSLAHGNKRLRQHKVKRVMEF
jgi:hypothetical protein